MAIYKYTLTKYLKSISTWVIIFINIGVIFGLVGGLAFGSIKPATISSTSYQTIVKGSLVGMISMFALLGAIFVGYKGARMFKDEVEDGTFLIVLSKPQPRSKIIFQKWLAVFTMIIIFMLASVGAYVAGVALFDHPREELKSVSAIQNIVKQSLILFGLGIVILLILSSISIMVSTKLSSGGTIGITTSIAIFIPITGFIGTFVDATPYIRPIHTTRNIGVSTNQIKTLKKQLADATYKNASQFVWIDSLINNMSKKLIDIYTNKDYGLGRIAFTTGEKDTYRYLSFIDLNYQLGQLGKIAVDATSNAQTISSSDLALIVGKTPRLIEMPYAVKSKAKPSVVDSMLNKSTKIMTNWNSSYVKVVKDNLDKMQIDPRVVLRLMKLLKKEGILNLDINKILNFDAIQSYASKNNINPVEKLANVKGNINDSKKIKIYLDAIAKAGKLDIINYKDYLNRYWILLTYFIIASLLMPLAYLVVKKQDFR